MEVSCSLGHVLIQLNTQAFDFQTSLDSTEGKEPGGQVGSSPCAMLPFVPLAKGLAAGISCPSWTWHIGRPGVQDSSWLPLRLLRCSKSLSCSACGPISIATPCDATEEGGSFRKVWEKGLGPRSLSGNMAAGGLEWHCGNDRPAGSGGIRHRATSQVVWRPARPGLPGWPGPVWLVPVCREPAWVVTEGTFPS